MTFQQTDLYKKRTHFTITELAKFSRCPRAYFYSCGCGLRQPVDHSALTFGTCIHTALPLILTQGFEAGFEAFKTHWTDALSKGTIPDEKRNLDNARLMLLDFASIHKPRMSIYEILPPPKANVKVLDRVSDYEVPFAIAIDGLSLPLCGRIDAWGRHRDTGDLYAIEFKTTSESSSRFIGSFLFNPQAIGYALALEIMTGQKIKGTFIESLAVAKTKTETLLNIIDSTDHHREMFLNWVRLRGNEILACEHHQSWTQDPSACTTYPQFGQPGYRCDYEKLCLTPKWTDLTSMYRVEHHLPYDLGQGQNGVSQ